MIHINHSKSGFGKVREVGYRTYSTIVRCENICLTQFMYLNTLSCFTCALKLFILVNLSKPQCHLVLFQNRTISHAKGSHGLPGIFVKYDLSSIRVHVKELHKPYWEFLVRLCGIIGGIFATSGMSFDQCQVKSKTLGHFPEDIIVVIKVVLQ